MDRQQILENALCALFPKEEYDIFNAQTQEKAKKLKESAQNFKKEDIINPFISRRLRYLSDSEILPQGQYTNIPFRVEEYDTKSTIASSGCAILVAKCLEKLFKCEESFLIEELSETAVKKGYRGYKKNEDGEWIPMGCRHVFFDRFIPSVYGLEVKRADSIENVLTSLEDDKIPVLLVSNKSYKKDETSIDSHFLILVGYNKNGFFVWDSEEASVIFVEFGRVIDGLKVVWIIEKTK